MHLGMSFCINPPESLLRFLAAEILGLMIFTQTWELLDSFMNFIPLMFPDTTVMLILVFLIVSHIYQ